MRVRLMIVPMLLTAAGVPHLSGQGNEVAVDELTIASIHEGLDNGAFTCRGLVEAYLRRIAVWNPVVNALVVVHPRAVTVADSLDQVQASGAPRGPLHCVPLIVKDNYDTKDLPTTGGSLALADLQPAADAPTVARLRAAGVVILAKSNMAELAFSPYETVSSILPGYTRNPYALDRVTAGSSGGTAAAVAANLGAVGLGTDTGNSIRGPSAHQALVGMRSTMGLVSRTGIVPLNLGADVAGPMTRTVADAAAVLEVMAGPDSADPVTLQAPPRTPGSYLAALDPAGLRGARLGVLRAAYVSETLDPEVDQVFQGAVAELRRLGAVVVDDVPVPELDSLRRSFRGGCNPFKAEFERYLASHGDRAPIHTLEELVRSRKFHPSIETRLRAALAVEVAPEESPGCQAGKDFGDGFRAAVLGAMDRAEVDALIYPTWSNPPRLIGDLNTPHGDNNQLFAPRTGFPAITVPMGYTRNGVLPAGLQFFGRPWSEAMLFRLAHSWEQATHHRRPPEIANRE